MTSDSDLIQLGFIRGAHALKGQVAVHIFSGNEDALTEYGPLYTADRSKSFQFKVVGDKGDDFLCQLDGVTERNGAEALKGTKLYVPASALPELDEDEFYIKDLIGMTVLDPSGVTLGRVKEVSNFGAHDALEIEFSHNGVETLPRTQIEYVLFTKANVPELNLTARTMTLNLPHGLFDIPEKE